MVLYYYILYYYYYILLLLYYILYTYTIIILITIIIYYTLLSSVLLPFQSPFPSLLFSSFSSHLSSSPLLIYLLILSSSSPFLPFSSLFSPNLLFLSYNPSLLLFSPSSSLPFISQSFKVYVSGLPSPYLYSISFQDNSTPHVLSDGNVEWCSFISIGFWFAFDI